jgi:sugar O-acyltransferase (sialic acid O-acetyltransferase NeuD family)
MDIIIIGAGGHSKVLIDILEENNELNILGLLDDNKDIHGQVFLNKKVLGPIESIKYYDPTNTRFVLSIGNNQVRRKLFDKITSWGFIPYNAISKDVVISRYAKLGRGLVINAGVKIHPDVHIGDNVILGMNATISHDSIIERDVHISPGVHLTGSVFVATGVDIGTGAVVIPGVKIGKDSVIGAGAVVTKNVPDNVMVAGVPAIIKKQLGVIDSE